MKEDDPLDDLCDVLEDSPDQHALPNLNKLELDRLPGQPRQPLRPPRRGYLGGAPQLGQVFGLGWVSNKSQQ